jgi:hypothetical protein
MSSWVWGRDIYTSGPARNTHSFLTASNQTTLIGNDVIGAYSTYLGTTPTSQSTTTQTGTVPAIDGYGENACSGASSCTVSLNTRNSPDVVMLFVYQPAPHSITISDAAGLTWNNRTITAANGVDGGYTVYWAIASSTLPSESITASLNSGTGTLEMDAFGVSNARTSSPFDTSTECFVKADSVTPSNTSSCWVNANARDLVIGFIYEATQSNAMKAGGDLTGSFSQLPKATDGTSLVDAEYSTSAAYSYGTVSWTNNGTATATISMSGDSIVPRAP